MNEAFDSETPPVTIRRGGSRVPRLILTCFLAALALSASGCFTSRYTVGSGPRGGETRVHRTWYAAWGFVSMNGVDGSDLVGPGEHLRVTTSFRASDVFFNIFVGPLGFFRQTTLIEK